LHQQVVLGHVDVQVLPHDAIICAHGECSFLMVGVVIA
jgi:hypothetical protein